MTVVLFTGIPGTLKTTLATSCAHKLGWAYLPGSAFVSMPPAPPSEVLSDLRKKRYRTVANLASILQELGANVILDGGYGLLDIIRDEIKDLLVVHCKCTDENTRMSRLARRAVDPMDHERGSAAMIISSNAVGVVRNLQQVLEVDTFLGLVKCDEDLPVSPAQEFGNVIKNTLNSVPGEYRIKDHFDGLADDYDAGPQWRSNGKLLDSILTSQGVVKLHVLDVGCGTGEATAAYAARGDNVVGVDVSPRMMALATEKIHIVVNGLATDLPFANDVFDVVVLRQVLHYVDPGAALREISRVMSKGATAVIAQQVAPTQKMREFLLSYLGVVQPLRRHVFLESDIVSHANKSGLVLSRAHHIKIQRNTTNCEFNRRAPEPEGGWNMFLEHCVTLANTAGADPPWRLVGDALLYDQNWSTLHFIKE